MNTQIIMGILSTVIAILFGIVIFSHITSVPVRPKREQTKLQVNEYRLSSHVCYACGQQMTSRTVVCPQCGTITRRVRDIVNTYPNKSPLDFHIRSNSDDGEICPLCHKRHLTIEKKYRNIPIVCCPHCYGYFLIPDIIEPYICSTKSIHKATFTQLKDILIFLSYPLLCIDASFRSWLYLLAAVALFAPLLYLRNRHNYKKNEAKSQRRFEQNPDYLQLLADMGYLEMMKPEIRSQLKKYGPEGEAQCEYCNHLTTTDDAYCPHCTALLPAQRYYKKKDHGDTTCKFCSREIYYVAENCKFCGAPIPTNVQKRVKQKVSPQKADPMDKFSWYALIVLIVIVIVGAIIQNM